MKFTVSLAVLCIIFCVTNIAAKSICNDDYFRCGDGTCIPKNYVCNKIQNCIDGSDEFNCPVNLDRDLIDALNDQNWDAVKELIQQGANINVEDEVGRTALYISSLLGKFDLVEFLIEKGADVKAYDGVGQTALHVASSFGKLEIVKYLLEKGADFECKDVLGRTALHQASSGGRLEVVKYLVAKGANINAKNHYGQIAEYIATLEGHMDVVKFLRNVAQSTITTTADPFEVCTDGYFLCGDGTCFPKNAACNGIMDCIDGLDEANCHEDDNVTTTESNSSMPKIEFNSKFGSLSFESKPLKYEQERTLILLKPETVHRKIVWKIIERFEDLGLKLVALKFTRATKEMAEENYVHIENRTQYAEMYMTSGPIIPMVWEGKNVIEKTLRMIGKAEPALSLPGTIRSDFGADAMHNIIHGSLSIEAANREISIWFHKDEIISWTSADEQ